MQAPPPTSRTGIRPWLAVHWLAIASIVLGCLGILCLLLTPGEWGSQHPTTTPLSPRQVRRTLRAQAARLDSIKRESGKIPALTKARDSALVAARQQNARTNYLLNILAHEALPTTVPASAQPVEHLARARAAYQPGSYALDSTHSIR